MIKFASLIFLSCLTMFSGCQESGSPSSIYEEYNGRVIEGISFEEERQYFSNSKLAEVEGSIQKYMAQMQKSRNEVIKFYLDFSHSVAKCKRIKLLKEEISAHDAVLTYAQVDTCGNHSEGKAAQTMRMVNENGWKIASIEISL